jgi:hypothetical protein
MCIFLPSLGGGGGRVRICNGGGAFIFFKDGSKGDIAGG